MYNSLSRLPSIPYNIIKYLATQDEIIWKLLKYNTYDALSKPNLSMTEKLKFIWKTGPQEPYGIFLTPLVEDAITKSKCILKIYNYDDVPVELYRSVVTYAFDFLYGGEMSLVEYNGIPVSRGDLFINRVLEVLNGADVGGIGQIIFSREISRNDGANATIGNSKTFTGIRMFLSVAVGDSGKSETCEN